MRISRSKTVAALALAAGATLLSGCASSTLVPIKTLDTEVRPYRSVRISVESKVAQDVSKEISQLQGEIVSRIRETKRFDEVTLAQDTTGTAGLLVRTSVIGIRKVGAGGLNFSVRNGKRCDPSAIATGKLSARDFERAALLQLNLDADRRPTEHQKSDQASRTISTGRLNASPRLHLRPINLVISEGPL